MNEHGAHPSLEHGSAHDTLRWGETLTLPIPPGLSVEGPPISFNRQLIAAHWRWPLSWNCLVLITPQFNADETADLTLYLNATVGVGQAIATTVYEFDISSPYAPQQIPLVIPAQDLQITASVSLGFLSKEPESLQLACFVAPVTEPHAMTHLLDKLRGEREEAVHWMPPGFNEAAMGYRR